MRSAVTYNSPVHLLGSPISHAHPTLIPRLVAHSDPERPSPRSRKTPLDNRSVLKITVSTGFSQRFAKDCVVPSDGFEPSTYRLGGGCSIP